MVLNDLKPGERGKVIGVSGAGAIRRRLLDLGLHCGEVVELVKAAPLRDPLEIAVCGGHISIRRSEAALITVEVEAENYGG